MKSKWLILILICGIFILGLISAAGQFEGSKAYVCSYAAIAETGAAETETAEQETAKTYPVIYEGDKQIIIETDKFYLDTTSYAAEAAAGEKKLTLRFGIKTVTVEYSIENVKTLAAAGASYVNVECGTDFTSVPTEGNFEKMIEMDALGVVDITSNVKQFSEPLAISFPYTPDIDFLNTINVYYVSPDGETEKLDTVYDYPVVTFKTNHLSSFCPVAESVFTREVILTIILIAAGVLILVTVAVIIIYNVLTRKNRIITNVEPEFPEADVVYESDPAMISWEEYEHFIRISPSFMNDITKNLTDEEKLTFANGLINGPVSKVKMPLYDYYKKKMEFLYDFFDEADLYRRYIGLELTEKIYFDVLNSSISIKDEVYLNNAMIRLYFCHVNDREYLAKCITLSERTMNIELKKLKKEKCYLESVETLINCYLRDHKYGSALNACELADKYEIVNRDGDSYLYLIDRLKGDYS